MRRARGEASDGAGLHTLNRKCITSPSFTTYSLPSSRILPAVLRALLALARDEVVEGDDLGADEALLEVGVDDARGLRRRVAAMDRPRAHFLRPRGEVRLQAEQLVARVDHAVEARLGHAHVGEEHGLVVAVEVGDLALPSPRTRRRPARLPSPRAPSRASSSGLSLKPCSATLATYIVGFIVSRKNGCSSVAAPRRRGLRRAPGWPRSAPAAPSRARRRSAALPCRRPSARVFAYFASCFSTVARSASASSVLIVSMSEIGSHLARDVHDVVVLEAAHDVRDRVGLADVGEELVAEALALRRARDQPRDVDELDDGGNHLLAASRSRRARPAAGRAPRRCRRWARSCRTDSSPPRCRPWSAH